MLAKRIALRPVMAARVRVVALVTLPMADAHALHKQSIRRPHVAPAVTTAQAGVSSVNEPLVGYETGAAILVRQVRPSDIIENVMLDARDGGRQGGNGLGT